MHPHTGTLATDVALVGEIGIGAAYEVARHISLLGGYRWLWVDGVALASDQAAVNPPPLIGPAAGVDTSGDLFYNGAFVGLEVRR
jgi:hypothetical protein